MFCNQRFMRILGADSDVLAVYSRFGGKQQHSEPLNAGTSTFRFAVWGEAVP